MTLHHKDCGWQVDQYPWECTCGVYQVVPKPAPDALRTDISLDAAFTNGVRACLNRLQHLRKDEDDAAWNDCEAMWQNRVAERVALQSRPVQSGKDTEELDRLRAVAWAAQGLLNADTYVSSVPREQAVSDATLKLRQVLGTWQMHHTAAMAVPSTHCHTPTE